MDLSPPAGQAVDRPDVRLGQGSPGSIGSNQRTPDSTGQRVDLPIPTMRRDAHIGPLSRLAPEPIKLILNWGRRYSLWVFGFGLACCAIEFISASMAENSSTRPRESRLRPSPSVLSGVT